MAAKIKFLEEKISKGRLDEPLAIRPTSETSMYPHFAKWIRSHRDLPYKVNQWNNVVRWEFKKATPFIRSREFLWQEGHTCYSNEKDARIEVDQVLDLYECVYRELLAVPTIKGTKTEKEKFAGAEMTKTIETFISGSGKAIQAATSHYLGQNFSKMFNISFEKAVEQGKQRKEEFVYQNSWGFTTRSIGIMIMTHSDDKGLILPPNIAPCQVMIVPIYQKNKDDEMVDLYAKKIQDWLRKFEIRVSFDNRKGYRPGFKYNLCETNGIPLRIDIGNRDVENSTFDISRRDTLIKTKGVDFKDLQHLVNSLLLDIQNSLYAKAKKDLYNNIIETVDLNHTFQVVKEGQIALIEFCGNQKCEEFIKEEATKLDISMKSLCVPENVADVMIKCFGCNNNFVGKKTLFGKSY